MAPLKRAGPPKTTPAETISSAPRAPRRSPTAFIAMAIGAEPRIQRKSDAPEASAKVDAPPAAADVPAASAPAASAPEETGAPPPTDAKEEGASGVLVVEDGGEPGPGQLTKAEFLRRLGETLETRLSETLMGSGYTAASCPTIAYWLSFAEHLSASRLERGLRLYAGMPEMPEDASQYLDRLVARVQVGVAHWRATGEVTGVPAEWEAQAAKQEAAFQETAVQAKPEGAQPAASPDPRAVQGALGAGTPLPGSVRGPMEGRLDADFGHVRIHTGPRAAQLSRGLGARAFTVGREVAFAPGEYAPGTLRGDLLLAHELAHTQQQGGARVAERPARASGGSAAPGLERQANLAAASAFAPELSELYGGVGTLDEETLLREAENAPLRPSAGLRLQRCEGCGCGPTPKPSPPPVPWWEEPESLSDSTEMFCRPAAKYRSLLDLLRQVDVKVTRAEKEVLKMTPSTKKKDMYIPATVSFTQWTPADVQTELKKILPMGGSGILTDDQLDKIKKVVSDYRAKHPNTFSVLQGIEAAKAPKWPTSDANCIATMNKTVTDLYGPKSIKEMSELGTTVQDSIDAVDAKGLVSEKKTFAAVYAGSATRYQLLDGEKDVTLTGVGKWAADKAMAQQDGVHAFLLSIANGFHSVTILAMKGGGKVTLAWKDQIETAGTTEKTEDEVDKRIRQLCVSRYRYWVRDKYVEKHKPTTPTHDLSYEKIKAAITDDQLKEIESEIKSSVNRDISLNTLAKLQPPKP